MSGRDVGWPGACSSCGPQPREARLYPPMSCPSVSVREYLFYYAILSFAKAFAKKTPMCKLTPNLNPMSRTEPP